MSEPTFSPYLRLAGYLSSQASPVKLKKNTSIINIPPRKLLDYELVYILEGSGTTITEKTKHVWKKSDLFLISPNVRHWHIFEDVQMIWVHLDLFNTSFQDKTFIVPGGYKLNQHEEKYCQPNIQDLLLDIQEIQPINLNPKECIRLMEEIIDLDQELGFKKTIRFTEIISRLLSNILQLSNFSTLQKSTDMRLEKAKYYLETNLYNTIPLEEIASIANFAPHYFSHQFKTRYGESPYAYHIRCRVNAAAYMLLNGTQNISEISNYFGFDSIYNFSRVFKKLMNMSPRAYLQKEINKTNLKRI